MYLAVQVYQQAHSEDVQPVPRNVYALLRARVDIKQRIRGLMMQKNFR